MVSGSIRLCERLGWDLSWCQALCVAFMRDIWHFFSAESSFLMPNGALGRRIFRSGTCVSSPDVQSPGFHRHFLSVRMRPPLPMAVFRGLCDAQIELFSI